MKCSNQEPALPGKAAGLNARAPQPSRAAAPPRLQPRAARLGGVSR